jgi:diguanylate cyclase (GGDEF)-like protein/PAS domain S-box-containing protein
MTPETRMTAAAPASPDDHTAARLKALLVRAPTAIAFVSGERFQVVSEEFNHLFGFSDEADLTGQATRVVHTTDLAHAGLNERAAAAFAAGQPLDEEIEYVKRDGHRFWGRLQATPVNWEAPQTEALWIIEDVTTARAQRLQPTWTAKHDTVTELANRREFERRLAEHVGSRRNEPVSVLWLDVDHFGAVIQGMGSEVGDHFLYGLGQMLISKVRASDLVARLEEDHFAILLPDCDQHYAHIIAEKVRAAVAAYRLRWGMHRTRVKASLGVVQIQASLTTVDAVLGAAALACTEAKAAGGDSVRVFVSAGGYEELAG